MTRIRRSFRRAAIATAVATGILAGATAVPFGTAAPATAATTTPVPAADIVSRAVDQAKQQGVARDYTPAISKPTWKILFVGVADVSYTDGRARQTMDAAARAYTQNVVTQFVDVLDKRVGVRIEPTVKWIDAAFANRNPSGRIDKEEAAAFLPGLAGVGEFDSIVVFSKGNAGGGTWSQWNAPETRGSTYSYVAIDPPTASPAYPAIGADIALSTNYAVHEFAHVLSTSAVGFPYPDLHAASSYGYAADPRNEWIGFYTDYLTGKVKANGVPLGAYPKMWQVSPRFKRTPAMATVHFTNSAGRAIAPDATAFGVGGDAYRVTAPAISGYASVAVAAGSAPTTGIFAAGANTDITFVYSTSATKLAFIGGQTHDLSQNVAVAPGTVYFNSFHYRSPVPVTGYTYTDQLVSMDGARRADRLHGQTLAWGADGAARITHDGNVYTAQRVSDTLVQISVALKSPSTTFSVYNVGYGNLAPTARVHQAFDVLDITTELSGTKEAQPSEPRGTVALTWGAYSTKVTFAGGETTDLHQDKPVAAGYLYWNAYSYRTSAPITGYTYSDRVDALDGVRRGDVLHGVPLKWDASGTAVFTKDGNSYTVTRKSDLRVDVSVSLGAPTTSFTVWNVGYGNTAAPARAKQTFDVLDVTPQSTGVKEATPAAPHGSYLYRWGDSVG